MEEILIEIRDELRKLTGLVESAQNAGKQQMTETDLLMKNLLSNLPANFGFKEVR